jgi:DNA-binding NtrC family response regulator
VNGSPAAPDGAEENKMARLAKPLVLVADDDPDVLRLMEQHLRAWDCRVVGVADKASLLAELACERPQLLLLDLRFGEHDGVELLPQLHADHPAMDVVLLTAHGSIDSAVTAMKRGAYDYLTKPPDLHRLRVILSHLEEKQVLNEQIKRLEQLVGASESLARLWGESGAIRQVRELIATVGPTDATVLILGESGTGKELVARALHEQSLRRQGPFVPVNMAALPRELVESTLFGHEKGAFTGADQSQVGCCEAADRGTLFLDEIGEMAQSLQSKLLRFLQEHTLQRVGSSKPRRVDVRVLAATNRDLLEAVQSGRFREDLYYRLNVVPIAVPPLRQHREDVALLAGRFLQRFALKYRKSVRGFTEDALEVLMRYDWPGNVRQLENLVERLVILATDGLIGSEALPREVRTSERTLTFPKLAAAEPSPEAGLRPIEQLEKQAILDALSTTRGNVREAARLLGCGQATVYRKIKRYGIVLEDQGRTAIS